MKEYTIGEWNAELLNVRMGKVVRGGVERPVKIRKFTLTKGKNPLVFCAVSVIDEDGTHEDAALKHILAALSEYHGEKEVPWSGGFDERI